MTPLLAKKHCSRFVRATGLCDKRAVKPTDCGMCTERTALVTGLTTLQPESPDRFGHAETPSSSGLSRLSGLFRLPGLFGLSGKSDTQTGTAFCATGTDNCATATGFHADEKAVGALTAYFGRLVCALHMNLWTNSNWKTLDSTMHWPFRATLKDKGKPAGTRRDLRQVEKRPIEERHKSGTRAPVKRPERISGKNGWV